MLSFLAGLIVHINSHGFCEFLCIMALCVWQILFHYRCLLPRAFIVHFYLMLPEPEGGMYFRYPIWTWGLHSLLVSAHWPVVDLCINCHLLLLKLLSWELRDALVYGGKDKNLEESLSLCPFSRVMELTSCLGLLPSKTCVWCLVIDTRHA